MTIFTVLMPIPQPELVEAIKKEFPNDHYGINETQWLISASSTVIEISAKIGIHDPKSPNVPAKGIGIIFATSSYYGRAPQQIWDWLKTKLEAPASG